MPRTRHSSDRRGRGWSQTDRWGSDTFTLSASCRSSPYVDRDDYVGDHHPLPDVASIPSTSHMSSLSEHPLTSTVDLPKLFLDGSGITAADGSQVARRWLAGSPPASRVITETVILPGPIRRPMCRICGFRSSRIITGGRRR